MAAGKHLGGFCVMLAVTAVLLLLSSAAYLLWLLLALLALLVLAALLLWLDARHLQLELRASSGGRVGHDLPLTLETGYRGTFLMAGQLTVELEIDSIMFGETRQQLLTLPLRGKAHSFHAELPTELCGETRLRCGAVHLTDALELFRFRCSAFPEVRTVLYPQPAELELLLSREAVGAAEADGLMQNRRGSDPSEIFDIRDYVPGDDIRTIHWKLSCKTDGLIVRQASDPSHYDVALLPDLGLSWPGGSPTAAEFNSAVAVTITLGEELLRQGTAFCLAIPTRLGLELREVRSLRELHELLPLWLGMEIPEQCGTAYQCFRTEHLEQYFTRLLMASAGRYRQELGGLERRIGITAVSTSQEQTSPTYAALGVGCEMAVLPAENKPGEAWRIIC